ncbi:MAG: YfcE family phosphodiesterase [Dehalococcoidia bacterium]|nr:YfcE family phosphodiesterase [Dehalococcoidia bacterium]MXY22546.1 YfcE family phosphodiesterase [Dehalococcoidia bacterium]
MTATIAIISDTHFNRWDEVHPKIREAVSEADIAVHCGDIVRQDVVDGMRREARRAVIVHGNSDPPDLRESLPYTEVIEVEGVRLGVTHPAWGGPEFPLEELLPDFSEPVDAILFGHLHETINETRDGILFLNPGQAYKSFMVPATIAMLTVSNGKMSAEIVVIEE